MKFFSGSLGGTSTVLQRIGQHPYMLVAAFILLLSVASLSVKALQDPAAPVDASEKNPLANTKASSKVELQINASSAQAANDEGSVNSAGTKPNTPAEQSVELTVNGQEIPIPTDSTATTTVGNDSSKTTITVQSSNSTTGTSADRSKLRIKATTHTTESISNRSTSQVTEEGVLQP